MTHGSLFSGIGGFDLAAQWMGWTNVFHCEFAEFPRKILHHYWPEAISYHDIKTTDFTRHLGAVDIITGGFPCQPYSAAGKRKGKDDDRHLWPEMLRAIREVRPRWIVGENVFGLTTWDGGVVLEEVCADLEAEGYSVQPFVLPACAVNAPHRRDRVWFVVNAKSNNAGGTIDSRRNQQESQTRIGSGVHYQPCNTCEVSDATDTYKKRLHTRAPVSKMERIRFGKLHKQRQYWEAFPTQSPICGGDDGLPSQLDGNSFSKWRNESIKAYGNAIVPQVAVQIFRAIEAMDNKS